MEIQVREELMESDRLRVHTILETILYRGELPRGNADTLVSTGERQARRVVSSLLAKRVLKSKSRRAPLRLAFPATLAARWMPGLCPERPSS
jgi:aspartokinase